MRRCLQLASYGKGFVAPNPMVGSVIVCENKIIGEGFHRRCGEAHAEVNAIASVKNEDTLKKSTLYVNLEPCSHYGKTPPCADLIIKKGIPRVLIGQKDPFPEVSGKGIERLREAGIEVVTGILEKECRRLNRRFLTFVEKKRPYIILKWAQSADGFIDGIRMPNDGKKAVKFSTDFTQMLVHKLRSEESGIMIGRNTELLDNPQLNVRYWYGRDPVKMTAGTTISLLEQMTGLYENKIQSLIVEGGAALLNLFISIDLWDEARVEIAPFSLKKGVKSPVLNGVMESVSKCENYVIFYNNSVYNS